MLISFLKTQGSVAAKKDDFTQLTLGDLREIPIPKASKEEQTEIAKLVHQILTQKQTAADTAPLEAEIDRLVYALYGLTEAEIALVEG